MVNRKPLLAAMQIGDFPGGVGVGGEGGGSHVQLRWKHW